MCPQKMFVKASCSSDNDHGIKTLCNLPEEHFRIHVPEGGEQKDPEPVGDRLHPLCLVYGCYCPGYNPFNVKAGKALLQVREFLLLLSMGQDLVIFHPSDVGNGSNCIEIRRMEHIGVLIFWAGSDDVLNVFTTVQRFLDRED